MLIKEWYQFALQEISSIYGVDEAKSILRILLEKRMSSNSIHKLLMDNKKVSTIDENQMNEDVIGLLHHKPIQYIVNESWFYKFPFYVDENVLIPRPETEQLVVLCLEQIKEMGLNAPKIIEIGTGSGCIAISLQKEIPKAQLTAIDISEKAIAVAQMNAKNLEVVIDFKQFDFLEENNWSKLMQYDLIVSNPPYIPIQEKAKILANVLDYEPANALFVTDEDPLIFYRKIAKFASYQNAVVCCEISESLGQQTKLEFLKVNFQNTAILQDFQGKDRMVLAKK